MKSYVLGLDIGGTKCAVILAEVSSGIVLMDRLLFATHTERGFHDTYQELLCHIDTILKKNDLESNQLLVIGISCGGPLDSRKGVILSPPNLYGWVNIPIVKMLEDRYRVHTFLQNDANACALAEWKLGAGIGCDDMVFLTMGTGFGGGIIAEGRLIRGVSDMGGEVGHVRLEPDGPEGFGKYGSMEGFCSGAGIAKQAVVYTKKKILSGYPPQWIKDGIATDDLNVKILADYANQNNQDALEIFSDIGDKLGSAISIIMDVLNPARFVIGSIFVRCERFLRPSMEKAIEREAIQYSREVCKILPASLGEQLGDYAAIVTALYGLGKEIITSVKRFDIFEQRIETLSRPGKEELPSQRNDLAVVKNGLDLDCIKKDYLHRNLWHTHNQQKIDQHLASLFTRYPDLEFLKNNILDAYNTIAESYAAGGKLLVCGNGGSAADADHIVGELMKGFYKKRLLSTEERVCFGEQADYLQGALPAISLTQHNALSTAFSNDVHPESVFAQQVYGYGRKEDVLLGISTSGNSENIVRAIKTGRVIGLKTIVLTGLDGGKIKALCDIAIIAPGTCTAEIQESHLPIYHTLCAMLEEAFFPDEYSI